jgi:hypothetical protein
MLNEGVGGNSFFICWASNVDAQNNKQNASFITRFRFMVFILFMQQKLALLMSQTALLQE